MKDMTKLVAFFAMATLSLVGCGSSDYSIAPVSGKVTHQGAPVPDLRVVFTPMPNKANKDPGPWSWAKTNDQGEFTLETRHKKAGAAVGRHTVSFEYEDAEDMEELQIDLDDAREEGTKQEVEAIRKRIEAYRQKRQSRPRIAEDYTLYFQVPPGGSTEANFDLTDKAE